MSICLSCLGQKKIQGMGFMGEVDCRTCKGTGIAPVKAEEPILVKTLEAKPVQPLNNDALTMNAASVDKSERLELTIETHEAVLKKLFNSENSNVNAVEPDEKKPHESIADKIKRKYTKSAK